MKLYDNYIPPKLIVRYAQPQKPQSANVQQVDIYEEALPYIECQMISTIRHEAGHRKDEEKGRPESMSFEEWTSEGRAEPIAEREEKTCTPPDIVSKVVTVNVNDIFQKAKSKSNVSSVYLPDVQAVILPKDVLGMYYMQDIPSSDKSSMIEQGWDGSLYINVGNFFEPWIAQKQIKTSYPPNIQFDGVESDPDLNGQQPDSGSVPAAGAVPSVPSIGAR